MNCKREDQNKHNTFAVTIYENTLVDEFVVGHVRICQSFFSSFYSFQVLRSRVWTGNTCEIFIFMDVRKP